MTWDHDRVEELLAAHVLGGLEGDDAELAERALEEHVPECPRCREALEGYRAVAGDLGLVARPVEPPDTVTARLGRGVGARGRAGWRRAGWGAAAAVVVAAAGLTAWNVALTGRLADAEDRQGMMAEAFSTFAHPEADAVPLEGAGGARVTLVHDPDEGRLYLIATELPDVDGVYTVWFLGGGRAWSPGSLEPQRGVAMMPVRTQLERWDVVMVTVEPEGGRPSPAASPLMSATVDAG
ncbi:MAG TPA: anti-sigma factor [Actinomycetota bacterium]|nr:anti-sigma factor [Actinomycetota bacterium]